jgi:hypothetical protein
MHRWTFLLAYSVVKATIGTALKIERSLGDQCRVLQETPSELCTMLGR